MLRWQGSESSMVVAPSPDDKLTDDQIAKRIEETQKAILAKKIAEQKSYLENRSRLPHLPEYGFKFYDWSREFWDSRNKTGTFLLGANQISKSSIQIRKCIHWATAKDLWPKLWPHLIPNQFWYLYPTKDVATAEWLTKWSQFMPGDKNDPVYGWDDEWDGKHIKQIVFKSGVIVYFKTYAQQVQDLQSGTVFALFCDEELPVDLIGELQNRLNATEGYFHMAFTATLGQDLWRRTMDPKKGDREEYADAKKIVVPLFRCMHYEDGSPSHWTRDKINRVIAKQPSNWDVQVRVYAKFGVLGGRKYEMYDPDKNRCEPHPYPKTWSVYCGVDIGSGGENGHKSAIMFIAVDELFRRARVFLGWRGDGVVTSAADVYGKYLELKERFDSPVVEKFYDFSSAEFKIVAERMGDSFEPADKKHENGERILNMLFKHNMLQIQRGDDELDKLSTELETLLKDTPKKDAMDDAADALRYGVTKIPWDFSHLDFLPQPEVVVPKPITQEDERRGGLNFVDEQALIDLEIAELNERY